MSDIARLFAQVPFPSEFERQLWKTLTPFGVMNTPSNRGTYLGFEDELLRPVFVSTTLDGLDITNEEAAFLNEFDALAEGECTYSHLGDRDNWVFHRRQCRSGTDAVPPPAGSLLNPAALAVDGTKIFVSDSFNHRIQVFDFNGNVTPLPFPIGNGIPGYGAFTYPSDPGTQYQLLKAPVGIVVDAQHRLAVADANARVAVFNSDGSFAFEVPIPDGPAGSFRPTQIAMTPGSTLLPPGSTVPEADADRRVVVTDWFHCQVHVFNTAFELQTSLPALEDIPEGSFSMHDACWDPGMIVATEPGQFSTVTGLTVDAASRFYVADHAQNVVQVFDKDAAHLGWIGKDTGPSCYDEAGPPSELCGPVGLFIDSLDRLGVADSENARTVFYALDYSGGAPAATFDFQLDTTIALQDFPIGIVEQIGNGPGLDPKGRFLVTDPLRRAVLRFELPELGIINATAANGVGTFDVAVPRQKTSAVTGVTVEVTAVGATILGDPEPVAPQTIPQGEYVSYTFNYLQTGPSATFNITAEGDGGNAVAPPAAAAARASCVTCGADDVVYNDPAPALGPPVAATLINTPNGAWYDREVFVRITPTVPEPLTPDGDVTHIFWFLSGAAADFAGSGTQESPVVDGHVDVRVRVAGASSLTYYPVTAEGSVGPSTTVPLPIDLEAPHIDFRTWTAPTGFDVGLLPWHNVAVIGTYSVSDLHSGSAQDTVQDPLNPLAPDGQIEISCPDNSCEGRNRFVLFNVSDYVGHTDPINSATASGGRWINIDKTAPNLTANHVTVTAGVGGFAVLAASAFGQAAPDGLLFDGTAGSGLNADGVVVSHAPDFEYPVGDTVVTFTATDYAGNVATLQRTVTVLPRPTATIQYTGQTSVMYAHTLTVSATVLPATALGHVTFSFGSRSKIAGLDGSGLASAEITDIVDAAGPYVMTISYAGTPDLNGTTITVPITVTPAPLTITADAKSMLYGGTEPELTYHRSGALYNGDTLSGALGREAGTNAGVYAIQQGSLTAGGNYDITYVGANLTIHARQITVTAEAKSKALGAADPPLTYLVTAGEVLAGDGFSGTLSRDGAGTAGGELPGEYPIRRNTLTLGPNYDISYVGALLTIESVVITVESDPITKFYGDPDPTLTYRITSGVLPLGASFSGALSREPGENKGNYGITIGSLSLPAGITLHFHNAGNFRIAPRPATVTAGNGSKIFGTPDPAIGVTNSGFLAGDGITFAVTRLGGESAGIYSTVPSASGAALPNYDVSYVSGTFTINKATVQVMGQNASKTYGDPNPPFTFVYGPLPGGLTAADIDVHPTCSTSGVSATSHPVVCSGGSDGDVDFTYVNGTFTVNHRPAQLVAGSGSKVFGAADPVLTTTQSGILAGDVAGITLATTRATGESVGSYATTATATGGAAANYAFTVTPGNFSITTAIVTLAVTGGAFTYDGTPHAGACTVTGADGASLPFTLSYVPGPGAPVNAGNYTVTCSFAGDGNHDPRSASAPLSVEQKAATLTAGSGSKVFGGAEPVLTTTQTGILAADLPGITLATTRAGGENVASYPTNATATGGNAFNYSFSVTPGTFTISPATVTVTAQPVTITYGDAEPSFGFTYGPFPSGYSAANVVTPPACGVAGPHTAAGSYSIACSGGLIDANVVFGYVAGTLTVNRKAASIVIASTSRPFAAANPTFAATVTGLVGADTLNYTLSTAADTSAPVGLYPITAQLGANPNYNVSVTDGTLTVTPVSVTVAANPKSKVYGDPNPGLDAMVMGDIPGVPVSYSLSTMADSSSGVGTYPITVALGANPNYSVMVSHSQLSVSARSITATAVAQSMTYGGAEPALTFTHTGTLVGSDAFTGGLERATGNNVGTYAITQGTLALSANYTLNFVGAQLTISQRLASVTAQDAQKNFGQSDPPLTATGANFLASDGIVFTATRAAGEDVGTYVITPAASGAQLSNYSITLVPGTFTIIEDNRPPVCTAATGGEIWPPNHKKFFAAPISGVTDPDGNAITIVVTGIWQDEVIDSTGDGKFSPDGYVVGTSTAWIRAERNGHGNKMKGNGRVYEILFTATDTRGAECSGSVLWTVPHNQGQGSTAIDDGVRYDSTGVVPGARNKSQIHQNSPQP